jgi:glycerophosphoryl diester phosphodiesterase
MMTSPPVTLNIESESIELLVTSHVRAFLPSCAGMQQRLPSLLQPPIAFAHRGAKAHAPENTLEAFALALKLGATGLESDVWLTSDGYAVLEHDGLVKQGRKKRPISEVARADLPPHIPSLRDVLTELSSHTFALSLDLKGPDTGAAVIETVRALAPDRLAHVWLCDPNRSELTALRGLASEVKLVHSTRLGAIKEGPEREASILREQGVDGINLHHTEWTGGLMALFHRFDRTCFAWDLQHDYLLSKLLRMGADGIYSDWVDRMMDAMRTEVG